MLYILVILTVVFNAVSIGDTYITETTKYSQDKDFDLNKVT